MKHDVKVSADGVDFYMSYEDWRKIQEFNKKNSKDYSDKFKCEFNVEMK